MTTVSRIWFGGGSTGRGTKPSPGTTKSRRETPRVRSTGQAEMVRVAVAALRNCNKADRTVAIVAALEELPVDLGQIIGAVLQGSSTDKFEAIFAAHGFTRQ